MIPLRNTKAGSSGVDHGDLAFSGRARNLAAGSGGGGPGGGPLVEDHEPAGGQPQAVELRQARRERIGASLTPDLELHRQDLAAEPQTQIDSPALLHDVGTLVPERWCAPWIEKRNVADHFLE